MEDVSHVLGAVVYDFDTNMCLICREGRTESFLLTLREPITPGAQKKPDLIEGIPLAPAVTGRVLLDAAAYLTWGVASERDDMKGAAPPDAPWERTLNSDEPVTPAASMSSTPISVHR